MDINPAGETLYTIQCHEAFLKLVENEYCAKHGCVRAIKSESVPRNNVFLSAMASGSSQSSCDPPDLPSNDEEYLIPNIVAEQTPGQSDCTASLLTAAVLYLNSLPESPRSGWKLMQTSKSTTPTEWRLTVHFACRISPTGGNIEWKHTKCTLISPMWLRNILYQTIWCRSGGQFVPLTRYYQLKAVKNQT